MTAPTLKIVNVTMAAELILRGHKLLGYEVLKIYPHTIDCFVFDYFDTAVRRDVGAFIHGDLNSDREKLFETVRLLESKGYNNGTRSH